MLVLDLIMRVASSATTSALPVTNFMERGAAVLVAGLFFLTSRFWADRATAFGDGTIDVSPRQSFVLVGLALIAWAALWAVTSLLYGDFNIRALGLILFVHTPPLLAGAALIAWSRHV